MSDEMAEGLPEAYYLLTKKRILLQIKQINGQQMDSYYLDPLLLSHDGREVIRQAVIRIAYGILWLPCNLKAYLLFSEQ